MSPCPRCFPWSDPPGLGSPPESRPRSSSLSPGRAPPPHRHPGRLGLRPVGPDAVLHRRRAGVVHVHGQSPRVPHREGQRSVEIGSRVRPCPVAHPPPTMSRPSGVSGARRTRYSGPRSLPNTLRKYVTHRTTASSALVVSSPDLTASKVARRTRVRPARNDRSRK